MRQSYLWSIVGVVLILVAFFYFYFQSTTPSTNPIKKTNIANKTIKINQNLDGITDKTNPTKVDVPEVNPIEKTNPFKNTYKNPFE